MNVSNHRLNYQFDNIEETIAMTTMYAANHMKEIKGIVAMTESGTTPMLMSRLSSGLPIFALSRHQQTLNWCSLYRGVTPVFFEADETQSVLLNCLDAIDELKTKSYIQSGDLVLVTYGDQIEKEGTTNTCKLMIVR